MPRMRMHPAEADWAFTAAALLGSLYLISSNTTADMYPGLQISAEQFLECCNLVDSPTACPYLAESAAGCASGGGGSALQVSQGNVILRCCQWGVPSRHSRS